ncbi:MAG: ROK family transcriptional regulator [Bacillota bacterium]
MKIRQGSKQLIRDLNVSTVVNTIRRHEPISRAELAERTQLGKSTVTGIVNELLRDGFLVEAGAAESGGGRPRVMLRLNSQARYTVGVKLAPTSVTTALTDLHAQVVQRVEHHVLPEKGSEAIIADLVGSIREVMARQQVDPNTVIGIGVVLPGLVDPHTGVSLSSYFLNWRDIPLKAALEKELSLPVFIDNDANAYALAEHWYGAGQGSVNMLGVTVGIGIGSGIIIGGQLYRGGSKGAGELGHITIDPNGPPCACGNNGCVEAFASDAGMARFAREAAQAQPGSLLTGLAGAGEEITRDVVVAAARQGDRAARQALAMAGRYLGVGLANAVNLLNPDRIVVGGEAVAQAGDLLLDPVRQGLRERAFSVLADDIRVVPARLGQDAWLVGAATVVLEEVFKPPIFAEDDGQPRVNLVSLLE